MVQALLAFVWQSSVITTHHPHTTTTQSSLLSKQVSYIAALTAVISRTTIQQLQQATDINSIIMVVRLRLQRFGRTHAPFYRMVAANARAPRDGKFLEVVGTYNPIANRHGMKEIRLKEDRLKYWLGVGAQPSDRVAWILGKFGILPPKPRHYNPQKSKAKKEAEVGGEE